MIGFDRHLGDIQVAWRRDHISERRSGEQNGKARPWILPGEVWAEGLWPGIRKSLPAYLAETGVEKHEGCHNLKSSWMLCANLYFPFRQPEGRALVAGFLRKQVSPRIQSVEEVELEYEEAPPFDPQSLLGEPEGGGRGANQTSPDVAFIVRTDSGRGLVLTENKLVEHSFYPCAGRRASVHNPALQRCMDWEKLQADLPGRCWQMHWEKGRRKNRRYWNHLRLSEHACKSLKCCPAATAGYQLFRQQALAEGIAAGDRYDLVASCVAYDQRNDNLIHCLRGTGVEDFASGWGDLFDGRAIFKTWTHQQWVAWVRQHDVAGRWQDWLEYVATRYGYTT